MPQPPPFCPNRFCSHHVPDDLPERWFIKRGTHPNRHIGPVQRFQCKTCRTTFSRRTFSVHFATHHLIDLERVVRSITSASGIRDIAREFAVSEKVILNRLSRLARQALGVHSELRACLRLQEDLVADGFESFVGSQYWPNAFTILIGAQSQYFYGLDYAQLRRKGRMTEGQRKRRDELNHRVALAARQTERSFSRILSEIGYLWANSPTKTSLTLTTDRHQGYHRVIDADAELQSLHIQGRFTHRRIDSTLPRTRRNPLFSVNYYDREIRKDQACHVRETVQWSRDVNATMDRMWLYGVWHTCFKRWRIRGRDPRTHAEHAGISNTVVERLRKRLFSGRYFFSHLNLTDSQWRTWLRAWQTPGKLRAPVLPAYVVA